MSIVSGRTNRKKKARAEATKSPGKIPDRETRESTAAVSHTREHISQCTSIFQNEYRKATSEWVKKNLRWEVFKVLHEKSPLPSVDVDDTLKSIQDELEKEDENESITTVLRENDVVGGKGERLCNAYRDRTLEFKNGFLSAGTNVEDRREVVSNLYMTLKAEGCRFLEKLEDGRYKEKDIVSGKKFVYRRMLRLCKEEKGDVTTLPREVLDAGPDPFESGALVPPNGIVKLRQHIPRQHVPNKMFRRTIHSAATTDTFERATKEEKIKIALGVMVDMRDKGFTFVKKEENVWKDMETDEVKLMVSTSLQKASKHYKKTKAKLKAGEDGGDNNEGNDSIRDDTAEIVDNDKGNNNRCIECNEPSSHLCRRCKRSVCSICCATKRELEMAWWCEECYKKQSLFNQMLIREGTYSSGDEDKE